MRYSAEHKLETRARVITAAGQVFRKDGYGGAGIDALTKAAGVTNGAFYGHFKSKAEAFRTAVLEGLQDLRQGIAALKTNQPKDWLPTFVSYYLGYKRTWRKHPAPDCRFCAEGEEQFRNLRGREDTERLTADREDALSFALVGRRCPSAWDGAVPFQHASGTRLAATPRAAHPADSRHLVRWPSEGEPRRCRARSAG